ncbi:MAG: hypothetical protein L6Q84_34855 [Polyangiaceae bacterium]|nr:hypothetical protein [Polyangiaceae bacterium]
MTYRRQADPERNKAWRRWIAENRSHLERLGLPLALYQDADHWDDFLANGHLHWHTDGPPFDFGDLGRGQMEQLCVFLEQHYRDKPPPLVGWLRVRLGKGPPE